MENQFDLNARYEEHLKICGMDSKKLNADHNAALKRMFFAGLKNMNDLIGNDLTKVNNKLERIEVIKSISNQINTFWNNEAELLKTRRQLLGKKAVPKIIKLGKIDANGN